MWVGYVKGLLLLLFPNSPGLPGGRQGEVNNGVTRCAWQFRCSPGARHPKPSPQRALPTLCSRRPPQTVSGCSHAFSCSKKDVKGFMVIGFEALKVLKGNVISVW